MSQSFEIVSRHDIGQEHWDYFVDSSDEAWLWHRFDLQDALSTWPGRRDLSFAVLDRDSGGKIVAVVPLHLIERRLARFFSWNVLDSLGGAACSNNLGMKYKKKIIECVYAQCLTFARQHDVLEINLALSPMAPAYRGEGCPWVNPLLHMGCENTLTQTYVIDLKKPEGDIWSGMYKHCRTHVRKAEKEGCIVREADAFLDIGRYYEMHCETYHRTGAIPHPFVYFKQIWEKFSCKGYSRFFLAECDGKLVAADNEVFYKGAVCGWTAAGCQRALEIGANNLLHWYAIRFAQKNGYEWYESGEGFPNVRTGKLKGLNDFKESFGGKLVPYYRGRIITRPKVRVFAQFYRALRRKEGMLA